MIRRARVCTRVSRYGSMLVYSTERLPREPWRFPEIGVRRSTFVRELLFVVVLGVLGWVFLIVTGGRPS